MKYYYEVCGVMKSELNGTIAESILRMWGGTTDLFLTASDHLTFREAEG